MDSFITFSILFSTRFEENIDSGESTEEPLLHSRLEDIPQAELFSCVAPGS